MRDDGGHEFASGDETRRLSPVRPTPKQQGERRKRLRGKAAKHSPRRILAFEWALSPRLAALAREPED
jgi:hypothetical protein